MKLSKIIILSVSALLVTTLLVICFIPALWPHGIKEAVYDCATCRDKGEFKCEYCKGKKDYKCDKCPGYGEILCRVCNGNGKKTCEQCRGTGRIKNNLNPDESYICYPCIGSGKVECPKSIPCECDRGTMHCTRCNENGKMDCPDC